MKNPIKIKTIKLKVISTIKNPLRKFYVGFLSLYYLLFPIILVKKEQSKIFSITSKFLRYITFRIISLLFIKKIRLHYDPRILENNRSLIISNHVTGFDWYIIYISLIQIRKKNLYFVAKKSLMYTTYLLTRLYKNIIKFIFIRRKLSYDYIELVDYCKRIRNKQEYNLVIFPEGTLITRKQSSLVNMKRSNNRNMITPKNVIIPKTRGTNIILNNLNRKMDFVIDCTLVYDRKKLSFFSIFLGKRMVVDVFFEYKEAPNNSNSKEDYSKWLFNIFNEKDQKLEKLIKSKEKDKSMEDLLEINILKSAELRMKVNKN